jgi:hypothetical protein
MTISCPIGFPSSLSNNDFPRALAVFLTGPMPSTLPWAALQEAQDPIQVPSNHPDISGFNSNSLMQKTFHVPKKIDDSRIVFRQFNADIFSCFLETWTVTLLGYTAYSLNTTGQNLVKWISRPFERPCMVQNKISRNRNRKT